MTEYKVGQILVAKQDIPIELALSGDTHIVPKGSKVIIGADKLAHHFDGHIQSLSKDSKVEGYDASGLTEYLMNSLQGQVPHLADALDEYEIEISEIADAILVALEEVGFA